MIWLARLRRRKRVQHLDGEAAQAAARDAERKLHRARRDWPAVHQAHDQLAEWVDAAIRGTQ